MEQIVEITSLVYEGYGFGRLEDGKAVFVPHVLPGEIVHINIGRERKRHAYGELLKIEKSHPERIPPKCKHFMQCGGCHYQHIPYESQLEFKTGIFIEQLQRMGGIEQPVVSKILPDEKQWDYRNNLQFHITSRGEMAFMDAASSQPFKVEECHLPMDAISRIWPLVSFDIENEIARVEVRQNEKDEVLLILEGNNEQIPDIEVTLPASVVHLHANKPVVISGNDHLNVMLLDKDFQVSAGSFFQTNFSAAETLVRIVMEMAEGLGGTLMDLYCGVGLFSSFLTDQFDKVIAIEASPSSCADFAVNLDAYDHTYLYEGSVEKMLPEINAEPDCVLVDPPRKGVHRFAIDAIIKKKPPAIIYVSCNPSTFARDAKRLIRSGYSLKRSVLVDMFPQTFHIESVNYFSLR